MCDWGDLSASESDDLFPWPPSSMISSQTSDAQPSSSQPSQAMAVAPPGLKQQRTPLPSAPIPSTATRPTKEAAEISASGTLKRKSSFPPSSDDAPDTEPERASSPLSNTAPSAPSSPPAAPRGRKRKGTEDPQKSAHNIIEKRYRTNLNNKFDQLRDAVPELRAAARARAAAADGSGGGDDYEELASDMTLVTVRLHKANILSKAAEYIAQLERRTQQLEVENMALRQLEAENMALRQHVLVLQERQFGMRN